MGTGRLVRYPSRCSSSERVRSMLEQRMLERSTSWSLPGRMEQPRQKTRRFPMIHRRRLVGRRGWRRRRR